MAKPKSSQSSSKPHSTFGKIRQGDLVCGLALAVTGVGPAAAVLPTKKSSPKVSDGEEWSAAFASPTEWCIVLSQDCDIVSNDESEPTVEVGLVEFVDADRYAVLVSSNYFARYLALPKDSVPGTPEGKQAIVDLAWRTSVLKLSLDDTNVGFVRVLTEPQRREFSEWLARRSARVPFPDDVVEFVLDPFSAVLADRTKSGSKKLVGGRNEVERLVLSIEGWYVHQDGDMISFIGAISNESLIRAGWSEEQVENSAKFDVNGVGVLGGEIGIAREKLHTQLQARLRNLTESGYQTQIVLADLDGVAASSFRKWRRYVR